MAITPPAFKKDAIPSLRGWHHPKTNELLKSTRHTQADIDGFNGVVIEASVPLITSKTAPCPDCDENGKCTCNDGVLGAMSKAELEAYAREHLDVELDRRKGKKTLMKQVRNLIKR